MPARFVFAVLAVALLVGGCSVEGPLTPPPEQTLTLTPDAVTVAPGLTVELQAVLEPSDSSAFAWRYEAGSLSADGASAVYVAPQELGDFVITVSVPGRQLAATATITVAEPTPLTPSVTLSSVGGESVVPTGMTIEIAAAVTDADASTLGWHATGGQITGEGGHAIYTAPHEPGSYLISASLPESTGVVGTFVVEVPGAILEPFTIAVIPDTQTMARAEANAPDTYPPLIAGIGEWLVANVEAENIEFVTQVGDVVWDAFEPAQWTAALTGLDLLDGVVPYSVSLGDHEYEVEENKASSTADYYDHFGPARYDAYDWYGGSHEDGLSQYQIFQAGGRRFLHLSLEWEPLGPADAASTPLGWAKTVLEAHPELPTFITTHAYLWDKPGLEGHFPDSARTGFIDTKGNIMPNTASGVEIFEQLVEPFPQVLMVFNGHYHKEDSLSRGEYRQVSENEAGLAVYEMLANYQWMAESDHADYIRLVRFVPGEFVPGEGQQLGRIEVSTFSPSREGTAGEYRQGESSNFVYELDLAQRLAFSSPVASQ